MKHNVGLKQAQSLKRVDVEIVLTGYECPSEYTGRKVTENVTRVPASHTHPRPRGPAASAKYKRLSSR